MLVPFAAILAKLSLHCGFETTEYGHVLMMLDKLIYIWDNEGAQLVCTPSVNKCKTVI